MNLLYATVIEVLPGDAVRTARVQISGAIKEVPVNLLSGVRSGDEIVICHGVAIAKKSSDNDVVGYSR
jgi:hydrogenase maturation factor